MTTPAETGTNSAGIPGPRDESLPAQVAPQRGAVHGLAYPPAERRPLRVYLYDPLLAGLPGAAQEVTLSVRYESLEPGPIGTLVAVTDFDGAQKCFYAPVDLDDPAVLIRGGLAPSEADPRFHQQMVYAVVMSVLERFERALGRRFRWRGRDKSEPRLSIVPHAFSGRNAYFDPKANALLFGYFTADKKSPGRNLPGQTIFTCLSHDIIAHETAHAVMHRLRPKFDQPTNKDVFAFHEAFADIVALFNHFTFDEAIVDALSDTEGALEQSVALLDLARQFGEGTGRGKALRSAIGTPADPTVLANEMEPHLRGAILVAGVFDGFLAAYRSRVADLLRIASGGTGKLPAGALMPDLVQRLAREASRTADQFFVMCTRALDYLPPVDVTFGDYLRAIVTADRTLYADDNAGLRRYLVEALRQRGIFPTDVSSLADDSLTWGDMRDLPDDKRIGDIPVPDDLIQQTAKELSRRVAWDGYQRPEKRRLMDRWAVDNRARLGFADGDIRLFGIHAAFRLAADGQPKLDIVVQFTQQVVEVTADQRKKKFGNLLLFRAATVIADADGRVRHLITKPLDTSGASPAGAGGRRFGEIADFVNDSAESDPMRIWHDEPQDMTSRFNFASIDGVL